MATVTFPANPKLNQIYLASNGVPYIWTGVHWELRRTVASTTPSTGTGASTAGLMGPTGPEGPRGQIGSTGPTGPIGRTSYTLISNPAYVYEANFTSEPGLLWLNTEDDILYVDLDGTKNFIPVTGRGPAGDTGPSVTGPMGPQGVEGAEGPQGSIGSIGPQGIQGEQGIQGTVGPEGPQGVSGPQGVQGIQGPSGAQGIQGVSGPQGIKGPTGSSAPGLSLKGSVSGPASLPTGASGGDAWFVQDIGNLFLWNTNTNTFDDIGKILGPAGPEGIQGPSGAQGPAGPSGPQGVQGIQGPSGQQGIAGPSGPQGTPGPQGASGPAGPQGAAGASGPQGVAGPSGPQGPKGEQGIPGPAGLGGGASISVRSVYADNTPNVNVSNVIGINFDESTGFHVTDQGAGNVKVSLGSSWKTLWFDAPQANLVAVGEDTLHVVAGTGITINSNVISKSLTFNSTDIKLSLGAIPEFVPENLVDPSWAAVQNLLNFNNSANKWYNTKTSATMTFSGNGRNGLVYYGTTSQDPVLDTNVKKWGNSSLYFDGTCMVAGVSMWPAKDGTTEFWIKPDPSILTGYHTIFCTTESIYRFTQEGFYSVGLGIKDGKISIRFYGSYETGTTSIRSDRWTHIALTYRPGANPVYDPYIMRVYVDGRLQVTSTVGNDTMPWATFGGNYDLTRGDQYVPNNNGFGPIDYVGRTGFQQNSTYKGWIDDIRISSIVRYTDDFTPPNYEFAQSYVTQPTYPDYYLPFFVNRSGAQTGFSSDKLLWNPTTQTLTIDGNIVTTGTVFGNVVGSTSGGGSSGGSSGTGLITVKQLTANVPSKTFSNISTINFDGDTGFLVSDHGTGNVKVSLGSSWKTLWLDSPAANLVATGEDTLHIVGNGVTINSNVVSKTLTFTATDTKLSLGDIPLFQAETVTDPLWTNAGAVYNYNSSVLFNAKQNYTIASGRYAYYNDNGSSVPVIDTNTKQFGAGSLYFDGHTFMVTDNLLYKQKNANDTASIDFWIKPDGALGSSVTFFTVTRHSFVSGNTTRDWYSFFIDSDGSIGLRFTYLTQGNPLVVENHKTAGNIIKPNKWHYIMLDFNTNGLYIYVNGARVTLSGTQTNIQYLGWDYDTNANYKETRVNIYTLGGGDNDYSIQSYITNGLNSTTGKYNTIAIAPSQGLTCFKGWIDDFRYTVPSRLTQSSPPLDTIDVPRAEAAEVAQTQNTYPDYYIPFFTNSSGTQTAYSSGNLLWNGTTQLLTITGDILVSGNVTSQYGVLGTSTGGGASTYGNANVAAYLLANPVVSTYSNANVASYLLANPVTGTYSNANVASYLPTYSGLMANVTITGNLYVPGNVFFYNSSQLTIQDNIINLHSYANLDPLTFNDAKDIGIKFHYYDTADQHAFLGRATDTGYLEWYSNGTETANVFSGTAYGTIKTGNLVLANSATIPTLTTTQVSETFSANSATISSGGTLTIDCNQGHIMDVTGTLQGNITVNLANLSSSSLTATSVMLVLNQGSTAYIPNVFQIAGSTVTVNWPGGSLPTGTANKKDIVTYSIMNTSGTYKVFGQLVSFG